MVGSINGDVTAEISLAILPQKQEDTISKIRDIGLGLMAAGLIVAILACTGDIPIYSIVPGAVGFVGGLYINQDRNTYTAIYNAIYASPKNKSEMQPLDS